MNNGSPHGDNAHPLLIFGGIDCRTFTAEICNYLEVPMGRAEIKPFPNGETFVKMIDDIRGKDVFVVVSLCRQHNPNERGYTGINDCLMELLVLGDTLRRASAHRITAVIPHFGYARQDRKAAGRTPITARLVADLIVESGFNRVLTMDLHADQIQGFFPRTVPLDHLNAGQIFADYFNSLELENVVLLAPDTGNVKKAEKYRQGFKFPTGLAIIDKDRDPETGELLTRRLRGDSVEGKIVMMFDDIISTAGTVRSAVDLALQKGAKEFYIGATHGELVGSAIEKLKHPAIKEVCITDTIPVLSRMKSELPLRIQSVTELFGEAILRLHRYESISELLGIYG